MDLEENITTLLSMGFENIDDIRKALLLGKNDINEAVSILTNEHSEYHLASDNMKDLPSSHVSNVAPPPYESLCDSQTAQANLSETEECMESSEFPVTNLYELESRIFTDHWSIPYKKEESLGKCLTSATKLAEEGLCEVHDNCRRFVERCLPEAFKKLLTSGAVRSWGLDVQEGVYAMLHLFINLITARLKHDPVPEILCQVLEKAFDPESEFHIKNKHKNPSMIHWPNIFAPDQAYAVSPGAVEPYGWLVELINRFGMQGGFREIENRFKSDSITGTGMAALLAPLSKCSEFLNPSKICPYLSSCMDSAVLYIKSLSEVEIKSKNVGSISELLKSMKLLCLNLWPQQVALTNSLCLEVILRMLKCPHFNARMNGLKEVMKLIDDSSSLRSSKIAIDSESLLNWLVENKVLSIALEGNIDQVQYTEKIKGIVEFTGHCLSLEELTKIWSMQDGQNAQIVDNIHSIMTAAASKFNSEQFDHLLTLVQDSWTKSNDQMRKRLTLFIGRLGKETNQGKTNTKVVDLLWDLSHSTTLPLNLVELALEEHFSILKEVSHKDQTKKLYCVKCIEDIRRGIFLLPSLRLLHNICKNILKSGLCKQDRASLHELNKNHDIIKLITVSLANCHKEAATAAAGTNGLKPSTIVDGRYTHEDYLAEHLVFLQFILQDGAQYLTWSRAKDIWETLISNPEACDKDKEVCFDWFTRCLLDLDSETQSLLFQNKLMKLDPAQLTYTGFTCFKSYFENVNSAELTLKRNGSKFNVEKLELNGSDFLWQVALSSEEQIANVAIEYLLKLSYHALSPRLKKDVLSLHNRFINECYKKLESVSLSLSGTAMITAVTNATKTLTAVSVYEVASSSAPKKSVRYQNICRLLQMAEMYISSIEENHPCTRTILPHGTSFLGHPILLKICLESSKEEYLVVTHSNETLGSVKQRIAQYFHQNFVQVHLYQDDESIPRSKEQRLLSQLSYHDGHTLYIKITGTETASQESGYGNYDAASPVSDCTSYGNHHSYLLEQEKVLPGVVMATGGQVFEKLYQLSTFEDSNITLRVRNLLQLIPTDPSILDALDSISAKKVVEIPSPSTPKSSPRSSPKKFTVTSPGKERCESPKEALKNLFHVSYQISPFKLLYNLEVLSGKLMPVMQDANTMQSAQMFSKDFLSAGGLQLILNVFHKDSIPNDVDYDIRHGCYMTALIISRYLLCGETGLEISSLFAQYATFLNAVGKLSIIDFCPVPTLTDELSSAVTRLNGVKAIDTIKTPELLDTLSNLVRLAWASAAGNLQLVNCALPTKEGMHCMGRRSRQSSTGSNTSSGSESSDGFLQGGVCAQQLHVKDKDVLLALRSLEFLVNCIHLRTDIFSKFASLSCINEFIIDVLLCSSSQVVRQCALEQLTKLSTIMSNASLSPRDFLTEVLLKARLPLWVPSSCTRGDSQRLLSQCKEYFELACRLLNGLSDYDQKRLHVDPKQMLEDEVSWLQSFSTSTSPELQAADSALLSGHFHLIKTLLTCEGVQKEEAGSVLIPDLLPNFLFPASLMISCGNNCNNSNISQDFAPKCKSLESRVAAYELLVELATGCPENMEKIAKQLLLMHHNLKPELSKEYEYEPLVAARSCCGYVGLKNAGATCYMNSVIQQLYMLPGVKEAILFVDENEPDEEGLFYQFQMVFGHLLESRLQYHTPENFWKCFRLWGEPINVREQQDAFEFFTHLIDQIDEYLMKNGWEPVFKPKFEGTFTDQKICQGCPHRYEREETFMALNLPVKSQNLIDSLEQFVKGELLEGHNAYLCEKCHEKRNTIKRTCIKNLPPVLVIQLKRFDYDWEANRSLKFDDYFKFPWSLDMLPYTADGIQKRETSKIESDSEDQVVPTTSGAQKNGSIMYDLVGVIVHSGQANAGHYYSYIKERRLDSGDKSGKWFKFNDITVEEFEMNDQTVEAECFGGTYKAKVKNPNNPYPEVRQRYWNAYMLLYEKADDVIKTPRTPRKTPNKFSFRKSDKDLSITRTPTKSPVKLSSSYRQRDSLSQLTQLVDRGERHGLFLDKMPARIQQMVREENLRFMHNRDIYSDSYFYFILQLLIANVHSRETPNFSKFAVNSILPLTLNFLLNTYFRYKKRSNDTMNEFVDFIEKIINNCQEASFWFIDFFSTDVGLSYLKPFLLDCPCREVRQVFARMLDRGLSNFLQNGGEVTATNIQTIISCLLEMLNHDVPDNCKSCTQYFWLLSAYAQLGHKTCNHLLESDGFQKLLVFLLGPASANMQSQESFPRRWTPMQTQEFGPLHITIASLILSCDLTPYRTCDIDNFSERTSIWSASETYLPMTKEVSDALYGPGSYRYLQEVVSACREVSGSISVFTDMIVQCCFCNEKFSFSAIHQVMYQYSSVPSNELKNLSYLLLEILGIEDPLQFKRVQLVIDGVVNENNISFDGMLAIIRANESNDSRRSYQGVKFLVSLSLKCPVAKDYLLQTPNKWQWAVNWLRKMMSEHTYWTPSNVSASNEDSNTKTFQRTVSAQDTLAEATALLVGLETPDQDDSMDVDEEVTDKVPSSGEESPDEGVQTEVVDLSYQFNKNLKKEKSTRRRVHLSRNFIHRSVFM